MQGQGIDKICKPLPFPQRDGNKKSFQTQKYIGTL